MKLYKHHILMQAHVLREEIEKCGCSEQITKTVIMAGALMESINNLVDENYKLKRLQST